ncbi:MULTISPECIES: ABC transporter ATP-binding protein [Robertmurraya]|uniref:ABC transporter ATP-binding protein n=1 Tax=Robertmurraya beringensis TaxID=641660 RepID=A0ABV6KQH6_9BACI
MKEFMYYFKQLYQYTGNIMYINFLGMVVVSFLDGVAILLLIPILSISGIINSANEASWMWMFSDLLKDLPTGIGLPFILGFYVILVFGQNLIQRNLSIRDIKIHQGFINHLKEEIYQSLLHVKWEFIIRTRKSNLINSLTKDINRVSTGIKMFMQFITNFIFTLIQIGIAFWLSPQIASLVLVCGLGLAFFSWKFVRQAKNLGKESTDISRAYLAGITDHLNGLKDIKTNRLEKSRMTWLQSLNIKMLDEQVRFVELQTSSQLSYKTAFALILSCFIFFSANLFYTQPEKLLIVIIIFSRLWPRFVTIQSNLQQLALTIPAFKVLLSLQNETKQLIEVSDDNEEILYMNRMIECKNVCFKYNGDNTSYALQNINLQIPANHMTAIVGQSGAGKSTLVDILMGLQRPETGELLIDGVSLTDDTVLALRKTISFVPQDPFLFNASIRQNLLLMNPTAPEEHLWAALEFAAAADFVKELPNGLDTPLGDRGIRLSGGERQRIVLARAILRNPSILILDEATSSLDTENESKIQMALERLKGKMTIIVIAHRLSTIHNADQVIVLDKGRIVQKGEYIQLANDKKGMFRSFLNKQLEAN